MIDEVLIGLDDIVDLQKYSYSVQQSLRNIFGTKKQVQKMFEERIGNKYRLDTLLNQIMLDGIKIGAGLQYDRNKSDIFKLLGDKEELEEKLDNTLIVNGDVVRLCDKHGITRANLAKALGTNRTRLYLLSKDGGEDADKNNKRIK